MAEQAAEPTAEPTVEELAAELKSLRADLEAAQRAAGGVVPTFIPYHAGGPERTVAETWGQYEQEQAHAADEAERAKARQAA